MFNKEFNFSQIYLIVAVIVAVVALFVVSVITYRGAVALEQRELRRRAETIALSLDPREITFLSGGDSDKNNPFYVGLKKQLSDVQAVNNDIRFLYLAGKSEGFIFFYLDNEPEGSEDSSPPGQVYTEASNVFHETFETGLPRFEGPLADRWGKWVSVFVAINHPRTGERLAVLGIDVDAFEYRKQIALSMATPALLIVILFMVFLVGYARYKKEEELWYFKAEFLSIASHDLRSPLTGSAWALENLLQDKTVANAPAVREVVSSVAATTKSVLEIIESILNLSRLENGRYSKMKRARFELRAALEDVAAMLLLFSKRKSVTIILDANWPRELFFSGDETKLKRAFLNIIANAIKYSPDGSTVAVGYESKSDSFVVSVSNFGPMIPKSEQAGIFGKFFRAGDKKTASMPGAGLGLYFAKQIINAHGGEVWFKSSEKETTFYVELPITN